MRKISVTFAFIGALGFASTALADGKEVFIGQKCNKCHWVESKGIEKTSEKAKGSDLSEVGPKHDAEWLKGYILKEIKLEDKKHKKKWKGTDEELESVIKWLLTLK